MMIIGDVSNRLNVNSPPEGNLLPRGYTTETRYEWGRCDADGLEVGMVKWELA